MLSEIYADIAKHMPGQATPLAPHLIPPSLHVCVGVCVCLLRVVGRAHLIW